ncbi:Protein DETOXIFICATION 27 [Dichanthelium oligosanthes]|uniref:Protein DETOXIFICATION n=1 Tax=Dichanthelium oligosanthes TaxID=888268 RepID=A0A1E5VGF4_9POAL|nr:Protein DETOXIFICATION 27 [Dichanthelium oligosanthes]
MDHGGGGGEEEGCRASLLHGEARKKEKWQQAAGTPGCSCSLGRRVCEESKKLWVIVGPAIFTRTSNYSMNVIMQAFAGHLGDLELASVSFACTVLIGFNYGIMLGMASALETLCGQAFGAKKYHMMGVYMQRSWIVLFMCALLLTPMYLFAEDLLLLTGQPPELSAMAGQVSVWSISLHFAFAFLFPLQRFLQWQLKNPVVAVASATALCIHVSITWLSVSWLRLGLAGVAATLSMSWWASTLMLFAYVTCGGCPETWHGFSVEAFSGIWEFLQLSSASGVMLWHNLMFYCNVLACLVKLTIYARAACAWPTSSAPAEGMAPGFSAMVSSTTSLLIGLFFCVLVMCLHDKIALLFTTSAAVLGAVDKLYVLLAFTILLNSVQPVLSWDLGRHDRRNRDPDDTHPGHHNRSLPLGKGGHDREYTHVKVITSAVIIESGIYVYESLLFFLLSVGYYPFQLNSMSWTTEEGLAWAITEMQEHAAELRKLALEFFMTRATVPGNHLNSILLTMEELARAREGVLQCTEVLLEPEADNGGTGITSKDEEVALELERLPSPEPVSLQEHLESLGIDYDSDQSRGV